MDGNLNEINRQFFLDSTINADNSTFNPTGRFVFINTIRDENRDGTMTVQSINSLLHERAEIENTKTRYKILNPNWRGTGSSESPSNLRIVVPMDLRTGEHIFDFSGKESIKDLPLENCIVNKPNPGQAWFSNTNHSELIGQSDRN